MKENIEVILYLCFMVGSCYFLGLLLTVLIFAIGLVEGELITALFSDIGIFTQLVASGLVWLFYWYPIMAKHNLSNVETGEK